MKNIFEGLNNREKERILDLHNKRILIERIVNEPPEDRYDSSSKLSDFNDIRDIFISAAKDGKFHLTVYENNSDGSFDEADYGENTDTPTKEGENVKMKIYHPSFMQMVFNDKGWVVPYARQLDSEFPEMEVRIHSPFVLQVRPKAYVKAGHYGDLK